MPGTKNTINIISNSREIFSEVIIMTTEEFLLRRKSPDWRLSTIVDKNSFKYVNRIHPLKQRIVKEIMRR